jgi:Na+/H+-dicarboxylate symporter
MSENAVASNNNNSQNDSKALTNKIIIGMVSGILLGLAFYYFNQSACNTTNALMAKIHLFSNQYLLHGVIDAVGQIFKNLLFMTIVPLVFVSLVCGMISTSEAASLGRMGIKTVLLYTGTTVVALIIAIGLAFGMGLHKHQGNPEDNPAVADKQECSVIVNTDSKVEAIEANAKDLSIKNTIIDMFPKNPIEAMAESIMLQVIIFALLFGLAIQKAAPKANGIKDIFLELNHVVLKLVGIIISLSPYGVFCLVANVFAEYGTDIFGNLFTYFMAVLLALFIQGGVVYSAILRFIGRLNPKPFFKKLFPVQLFAFSTATSGATIPLTMEASEKRLGVNHRVSSFVIPLGATINMDGTAIMQGVATVFIAGLAGVTLSWDQYLLVITMATLASIGTAGVPSAGLITLTMVLSQVDLPTEYIGIILGVDRLLDMVRTSVNITGDSMVSTLVAKSEGLLDEDTFNDPEK